MDNSFAVRLNTYGYIIKYDKNDTNMLKYDPATSRICVETLFIPFKPNGIYGDQQDEISSVLRDV